MKYVFVFYTLHRPQKVYEHQHQREIRGDHQGRYLENKTS